MGRLDLPDDRGHGQHVNNNEHDAEEHAEQQDAKPGRGANQFSHREVVVPLDEIEETYRGEKPPGIAARKSHQHSTSSKTLLPSPKSKEQLTDKVLQTASSSGTAPHPDY